MMKKPLLFLALSVSFPTISNGFAGIDTHHTFSRFTNTKDLLGQQQQQQQQQQCQAPAIGTYGKQSSSKLFLNYVDPDVPDVPNTNEAGTTEADEAGTPNNKRYVHIHVNEDTSSTLLDPDGKPKRKADATGNRGPSPIRRKDVADDGTEKNGPTLIEEIKSFTQDPLASVHVHFHPTSSSSSIGDDGRPTPKPSRGNVGPSPRAFRPGAVVDSKDENNKLTTDNIDTMHASILKTLDINTSSSDAGNVHVHFDLASLQPGTNDPRVASMNDITVPQDVVTKEEEDGEELYDPKAPDLPMGVLMTGGAKLRKAGLTGKGIKVGVIDTGIDRDHPGFDGKVALQKETWFRHGTPLEEDDHGTHVAGTIHMMAPDADIMDYRVFGKYGSWSAVDAVATAIFQACFDGCHIINMSVGGRWPDEGIRNAVQYAASQNVIVVCSAGNNGDNDAKSIERNFPACWPEAINVAAVPKDFTNVANFSNSNPEINYAGIGVDVKSFAPLCESGDGEDAKMRSKDGTSMACPHVTGLIAALMTNNMTEIEGDKQKVSYSDLIKDDASLRSLLNNRFAINQIVEGEDAATGFDPSTGFGFLTFLSKEELKELVINSSECSDYWKEFAASFDGDTEVLGRKGTNLLGMVNAPNEYNQISR